MFHESCGIIPRVSGDYSTSLVEFVAKKDYIDYIKPRHFVSSIVSILQILQCEFWEKLNGPCLPPKLVNWGFKKTNWRNTIDDVVFKTNFYPALCPCNG